MRVCPKDYVQKDGTYKKFADLDEEGHITPHNILTLKWLPNYYFGKGELFSIKVLYSFTTVFCILALFLM